MKALLFFLLLFLFSSLVLSLSLVHTIIPVLIITHSHTSSLALAPTGGDTCAEGHRALPHVAQSSRLDRPLSHEKRRRMAPVRGFSDDPSRNGSLTTFGTFGTYLRHMPKVGADRPPFFC